MFREKRRAQVQASFDSLSESYGKSNVNGKTLSSNLEKQIIIKYILEKTHQKDNILDVGCGWGQHLSSICQKCSMPVGIDFSKQMLLLGKKDSKTVISILFKQIWHTCHLRTEFSIYATQ